MGWGSLPSSHRVVGRQGSRAGRRRRLPMPVIVDGGSRSQTVAIVSVTTISRESLAEGSTVIRLRAAVAVARRDPDAQEWGSWDQSTAKALG